VEGRIGPTPVKGTAYFDWAKGRHCYVGSQVWTIGEDSHTTHLALIGGWDAAANETVEQGFSSTGDAATVRYSTRAPGESPEVIVGQIAGVSGPDRHWQGIVERNQFGPNKFTITTTVDGDIVHSLTYVRRKVLRAATDAPRNERESP
jgi:hypothetical protein